MLVHCHIWGQIMSENNGVELTWGGKIYWILAVLCSVLLYIGSKKSRGMCCKPDVNSHRDTLDCIGLMRDSLKKEVHYKQDMCTYHCKCMVEVDCWSATCAFWPRSWVQIIWEYDLYSILNFRSGYETSEKWLCSKPLCSGLHSPAILGKKNGVVSYLGSFMPKSKK